jgi:hypothetical protein
MRHSSPHLWRAARWGVLGARWGRGGRVSWIAVILWLLLAAAVLTVSR